MALSATLSLAPFRLNVNPRNLRLAGRSTALFSGFTVSRSESLTKRVTLAITRSPAVLLLTMMLQSSA